ncbi:SEC-C motif domain protein [Paenibacillus curdlanolyticus YK9]|uniref:SEC-C motif domain protein n=1 Tax=Paenibacillus curdlanolyticus YK9 TaxID=717606 RepID=E0IFS2_9BACL|nr:SEC-C metal-binding domain-containing protein [Paenibacillus curdlanolyticus]EFM08738.1 SEC-C motif domain protein [Paenibacillus curdlanolyticus YK9]
MNKLGRNEPCPCGSNLKYKRCCMEKDQTQAREQAAKANQAAKAAAAVPVTVEGMNKWISELSWKRPEDQEAAELLVTRMDGEYEPNVIVRAVWVWHCYADETNISAAIKPESYCAAVEYLMSEAHDVPVTQKAVAAKYGVSPTTLSKRNKELTEFFSERAANGVQPNDERVPVMA